MDAKDIYIKLDNMSEQIARLRESAARTETLAASLIHLQSQVDKVVTQQNQWKGAMIIISAIFSVSATLIARVLLK